MKREWMIDACSGKCIDVTEEQRITVVDLEGGQVVDFFAVSAKDTSEFLSTGVTIDCNESLRLHVGDLVYSNLYRPMFQICFFQLAAKRCTISFIKTETGIRTVWIT